MPPSLWARKSSGTSFKNLNLQTHWWKVRLRVDFNNTTFLISLGSPTSTLRGDRWKRRMTCSPRRRWRRELLDGSIAGARIARWRRVVRGRRSETARCPPGGIRRASRQLACGTLRSHAISRSLRLQSIIWEAAPSNKRIDATGFRIAPRGPRLMHRAIEERAIGVPPPVRRGDGTREHLPLEHEVQILTG